jgi:hypothetical protein
MEKTNSDTRYLIVAFDGLRPDMVDEDLTPNLAALCQTGSHCTDSRAVFPTLTRVNQASLITGCHPARHGMVANKFMEPAAGGYLNTADFDALSRADEMLGGILTAPSLGEILHSAGLELAVIGCGTPGGNRLMHHRAENLDALNISLHGIEKSAAPGAAQALVDAHGPIPKSTLPNHDQIDWVVDAYMQQVAPNRDPAVTIIWFSDPDTPFHYRGIESPEAAASIRHADAALGRLLAWRRDSGREASLQIVAMSDHGHVATHGDPLALDEKLAAAGFEMSPDLGVGEATLVPGTVASLYARDSAVQARLVEWLQSQAWCGPIFARAMDPGKLPLGTLPLADANLDHARAGDIVLTLHRDDHAPNGGLAGRCLHDEPDIPTGCGMHGGLSSHEVRTVLAFSGSQFANGTLITTPTGIIDILPTVLHGLGLDPESTDGRILHEVFQGHDGTPANAERISSVAEAGPHYRQGLEADEVGSSRYLAQGGRHDAPPIV